MLQGSDVRGVFVLAAAPFWHPIIINPDCGLYCMTLLQGTELLVPKLGPELNLKASNNALHHM